MLRGLAEMCAVYETTEIIAIATAAVRDAVNGPEFIRRVQEKTGIDFTVVSGREEARLIYLGVSSGLEHSKSLRLFIDIGGGSSTELIVGDSQSYVNLDSLKLGCVRLTNLFFEDNKGPVSAYTYAALQRYVRNEAPALLPAHRGFRDPRSRRQLRHGPKPRGNRRRTGAAGRRAHGQTLNGFQACPQL